MIAGLMFYGTLVSICLAGMAWCLERGAAFRGWPRRWPWAMVMILPTAMLSAAALRAPEHVATAGGPLQPHMSAVTLQGSASVPSRVVVLSQQVSNSLEVSMSGVARFNTPLGVLWLTASITLACVYLTGLITLARRRRLWCTALVQSHPVLVSLGVGPAVVGLFPPRVVLPGWALELEPDAVALIMRHEREHIRAADPWLLHLSAVMLVATPWNPAAWWVVSRLKSAVEIDCDARVLSGAVAGDAEARHRYGELLLSMASRQSAGQPFLAAALLESSSSLTRRIVAMFPERVRLVVLRSALLFTVALILGAAAVLNPLPVLNAQAARPTASVAAVSRAPSMAAPQTTKATTTKPPTPTPAPAAPRAPAQPTSPQRDTSSAPVASGRGAARRAAPAPPQFGAGALGPDSPELVAPKPVRKPSPKYTAEAMRRKIQGHASVEVVVGVDGQVEDVRLVDSLDQETGLDDSILETARQWTFDPGTLHGVPVRTLATVSFDFRLH